MWRQLPYSPYLVFSDIFLRETKMEAILFRLQRQESKIGLWSDSDLSEHVPDDLLAFCWLGSAWIVTREMRGTLDKIENGSWNSPAPEGWVKAWGLEVLLTHKMKHKNIKGKPELQFCTQIDDAINLWPGFKSTSPWHCNLKSHLWRGSTVWDSFLIGTPDCCWQGTSQHCLWVSILVSPIWWCMCFYFSLFLFFLSSNDCLLKLS